MLIERQRYHLEQIAQKYNLMSLKPPEQVYENVIGSKIDSDMIEEEYFMDAGNGKQRRRIYFNVAYSEKEEEKLSEVRSLLKQYKIFENFPKETIMKQLYAAGMDVPTVMDRLGKLQQFHNSPIITTFNNNTLKQLESGCLYTYGHDKLYRPIVVIQASKFNFDLSSDEIYNAVYFLMLVVMGYRMVPYFAEKYILLFDLNHMKLSEIPYTKIFQLLMRMSLYYCGNMEKVLVYNSEGLSFFITLTSRFIPDHAKKKVMFVQPDDLTDVYHLIEPYELERKYGGTLDNLTKYWPPRCTEKDPYHPSASHSQHTSYYTIGNNNSFFKEEPECGCEQCSCRMF